MNEKFRFAVFFGASIQRTTYRVVERDGMFIIQERLTNYREWIDAYKYAKFSSMRELFNSVEFRNLFINQ